MFNTMWSVSSQGCTDVSCINILFQHFLCFYMLNRNQPYYLFGFSLLLFIFCWSNQTRTKKMINSIFAIVFLLNFPCISYEIHILCILSSYFTCNGSWIIHINCVYIINYIKVIILHLFAGLLLEFNLVW